MKSLLEIPTARHVPASGSELRSPNDLTIGGESHNPEPVSMFDVVHQPESSSNSWVEVSSKQIMFNPMARQKPRLKK